MPKKNKQQQNQKLHTTIFSCSIQFYGECWSGMTAPLTYDRYGRSSNCGNYVGKSWANVVYRFIGEGKQRTDVPELYYYIRNLGLS